MFHKVWNVPSYWFLFTVFVKFDMFTFIKNFSLNGKKQLKQCVQTAAKRQVRRTEQQRAWYKLPRFTRTET